MKTEDIITIWAYITILTQEEASAVTISNPNPDFDGPAYAISVLGPWTEYQYVVFSGDSYLSCFEEAKAAYEDANTK